MTDIHEKTAREHATHYINKENEIHFGRALKTYEWFQYLKDWKFVLSGLHTCTYEGGPPVQFNSFSFEQLYAVLLEFERYPEMIDILVERHISTQQTTSANHPSYDIISIFSEFLMYKHGAGFIVPEARYAITQYALSGKIYPGGIRDESFINDLKSGKVGNLLFKVRDDQNKS